MAYVPIANSEAGLSARTKINGIGTGLDTHIGKTGAQAHGLGTVSTQAADDVLISGGSLDGVDITDSAISGGTITTVAISGGTMEDTELTDVIITTPALTGGTIDDTELTDVIITTPALTGGTIEDSTITGVTISGTSTLKPRFVHQKIVGVDGDFLSIKDAVDWFNASATGNTRIMVDAGSYPVSDTVVVDNGDYDLEIQSLGSGLTQFAAATGLHSKPMFEVKSPAHFSGVTFTGTTLATYGTFADEVCIRYTTTSKMTCEVKDFYMYNFYYGIEDKIGTDLFIFNFEMGECLKGIVQNYSTAAITTYLDVEVANFVHCPIGVDLVKATAADFLLTGLMFIHENSTDIGIKYTGGTGNYVLVTTGGFANIISCAYNSVGHGTSGFDFTIARDANVEITACVGIENKNPHGKLNVRDNAAGTTLTNPNTYYKIAGANSKTNILFNTAATAGTFTVTVGPQTTGNIAWNASAATIKTAIEALTNVTTVTVTQITASKEWDVEFITSGEGFLAQSVDVSGLTTTSSVIVSKSFYACKIGLAEDRITFLSEHERDGLMWISGNLQVDGANKTIKVGIRKSGGQIIAPFTVRTNTANQPVSFTLMIYVDGMAKDSYYELVVSGTNGGDVVTVKDLQWMFDTK
jgi:hypothetical protein